MASRRDDGHPQGLRGVDQGPADDAGGRRHPFAQRGTAPGARSLRLLAAGTVLHRRSQSGESAGKSEYGDLSRELGGHLCRHRMGWGIRRGEKGHRLPDQRHGCQEDTVSRDLGHRHQAGIARGHRTPGSQSAPVRDSQRSQVADHRAQGEHHEVHRRRLPRLGLRVGAKGVWRAADRRRPMVQVQEPENRPRDHRQGRHRRRFSAADPAAAGRVRRDRHLESQRRLHLRRAGGAGGWHRHCAGR